MSVKAAIAAIGTKKANVQATEVIYIQAEVSISPSSVGTFRWPIVPAGKTLSLVNPPTGKN